MCLHNQVFESAAGRQQADPEFLRTKVFQDRRHPSDVIRVAMRNRNRIETRDATAPKIGRDHIFSEVELGTSAPDGATRVDEQGSSLWHYQQDGVALAHVNGGHFKR